MGKLLVLILSLLALVPSIHSITKYDFNVCRISFCSDKQSACISDEGACMQAFSATRQWYPSIYHSFQQCKSADQLQTYNKCWVKCKQTGAYGSNGGYNAVGVCYENLCYLSQWVINGLIAVVAVGAVGLL